MSEYTQGTLIYGLRSQYYQDICCYGVIITARCDIAQKKVPVIHTLSAMSLHDWVCTELFSRAAQCHLENDILGPIRQWAKDSGLDFSTLLSFGPQKVQVNLYSDTALKDNRRKQLESSISAWAKWNTQTDNPPLKRKISLLNRTLAKQKTNILRDLLTGKFANNFCFIPGDALIPKKEYSQGIVVILRDIVHITLNEIKALDSHSLDYTYLSGIENGAEMLETLNKKFFLEKDSDFSTFEGTVPSPWLEYLMQNFSNAFTRIGVETLSPPEVEQFCENYKV